MIERQTGRERWADRQQGGRDRQTHRQTDRKTGRQANRQTDRQTDRQTGRERERDRQTDHKWRKQKYLVGAKTKATVHYIVLACK